MLQIAASRLETVNSDSLGQSHHWGFTKSRPVVCSGSLYLHALFPEFAQSALSARSAQPALCWLPQLALSARSALSAPLNCVSI
jgi:hypothetical protein